MKTVVKYVSIFLLAIMIMFALMAGVAKIPRELIQSKSDESAELLMRKDVHFYNYMGNAVGYEAYPFGDSSKIDQIADCILLSIAYYIDCEHPCESVLWARYYDGRIDGEHPLETVNESYYRTVSENVAPNKQYLRYWHGSLIFVRPLLVIWNIRQMKVFFGIMIACLLILLILKLWKYRLAVEAAGMMIAMIAVNIWFVPLSLEYIWMFIVMLVASIVAVELVMKKRFQALDALFLVTGMTTSFLDFLTTETLTVLIPLLFVIRLIGRNEKDNKRIWGIAIQNAVLWGIGYFGAWASKWIISSFVIRENAMPYVAWGNWNHNEGVVALSTTRRIVEALIRNIKQLFPLGYGQLGGILFFILASTVVVFPVWKNKIRLREKMNQGRVVLYVVVGLLPYLRYIILNKHAWFHFFFTYRAQAATVMALCFALAEVVQINHKPTHTEPGSVE